MLNNGIIYCFIHRYEDTYWWLRMNGDAEEIKNAIQNQEDETTYEGPITITSNDPNETFDIIRLCLDVKYGMWF